MSPDTSEGAATELCDTSQETPVVRKSTAVVTRGAGPLRELLVFEHDRTGLQLPAGTLEDGETFEQAAIRELAEETGITDATLHAELGHLDDMWAPNNPFHRHIFHFEPTAPTEERWQRPCDCGDEITLFWLPFASARLDHHQQPWLDLARAALGATP